MKYLGIDKDSSAVIEQHEASTSSGFPMGSVLKSFFASVLACIAMTSTASSQDAEPTTAEFFESGKVHDIRITVPEMQWNELRSESRNMIDSLELREGESPYHYAKGEIVIDGIRVGEVGVRKKGFLGSQDVERPSLKISFSKYQKGRTFAGLDRLTLNNNKQDRSLMSQYLTYTTFHRAGLPAPRISFAHVWVNDRDLGVYSNVESARSSLLKHSFGDDTGALYEGTVVDFITDRLVRFERKNGPDSDDDRQVLRTISELLDRRDVDVEELGKYVDLDQFLKFWAMESLIGFWDGYGGNQNNYFIYSHHKDGRIHFIPWGADVAFGKGLIAALFKAGRPECVAAYAILPNRLYQNDAVRDQYYMVLDHLLETVWDEQRLVSETERIEELLKPHASKDQRDHAKEAISVRRFINTRREELRKELSDGPPDVKFNERKPPCSRRLGTVTGEFNTTWKSGKSEPESVSMKLTLNEESPQLTDLKISVGPGGANPMMGLGPRSVTLSISGVRSDNEKPVTLSIVISGPAFRSEHKHPATAHGSFTEGKGGFFRKQLQLGVAGEVQFSECGRESESAVKGTFDLRLLQMDDGYPQKKRGKNR